ncbi:MAG: recombinase family protein [Desulfovibrio sp.]|nr:recombinase family protein [Desulfovibrio sp.]
MNYGYRRLGVDEAGDEQLASLFLSPDAIYTEQCSGEVTDRPAFEALVARLEPGDTVYVHSLYRLARDVQHLLVAIRAITAKGACVHFVEEHLCFSDDSANPTNTLLFQIFGALKDWEQALQLEREAEKGLLAKKAGRGRPSSVTEEQREQVRMVLRKDMRYNVARLSRETGVPESTCRVIRLRLQKDEHGV